MEGLKTKEDFIKEYGVMSIHEVIEIFKDDRRDKSKDAAMYKAFFIDQNLNLYLETTFTEDAEVLSIETVKYSSTL